MNHVHVLIWLTHPGDLLGEAIDIATHGLGEHAGFRRGNGMIHELYLPKPRDRQEAIGERALFEEYAIEGLTAEQSAALEAEFDQAIATGIPKYSLVDLLLIEADRTFPIDKACVCSSYVQSRLMKVLPPEQQILVRIDPSQVSPRDIRLSPRLHIQDLSGTSLAA